MVRVNLKSKKSIGQNEKKMEKYALVLPFLCDHTVYAGDGKRRVHRGFAAENLKTNPRKKYLSLNDDINIVL